MKFLLIALVGTLSASASFAQDIVVYGGTPGGIAAAISAARMGRGVALVEYHDHIGGMTTSGLGKSDIENRAMIGGIFKEFVAAVHAHCTTHVAFSSIRMEPSWMALGQAAGVAAHRAIQDQTELRAVPIGKLQSELKERGQVLIAAAWHPPAVDHPVESPNRRRLPGLWPSCLWNTADM